MRGLHQSAITICECTHQGKAPVCARQLHLRALLHYSNTPWHNHLFQLPHDRAFIVCNGGNATIIVLKIYEFCTFSAVCSVFCFFAFQFCWIQRFSVVFCNFIEFMAFMVWRKIGKLSSEFLHTFLENLSFSCLGVGAIKWNYKYFAGILDALEPGQSAFQIVHQVHYGAPFRNSIVLVNSTLHDCILCLGIV